MKTSALKFNLSFNKKGLVLFVLFCNLNSHAQSLNIKAGCTVTSSQLIDSLFDGNFTISNITESGDQDARGHFINSNTNEPLGKGIILSTGKAIDAEAPNNNTYGANTSFSLSSTPDKDLLTIVSSSSTFKDLYKMELDIIPLVDTLIFTYSFASEEYLTYSPPLDKSGKYNDVFGIFVSGPGITGTSNIATIPGTNSNVSVFTINPQYNSSYFVDNTTNTPASIQYNGYTRLIQAKIPVIRGQTYHIKIAIADLKDSYIDSGVFIKASGSSMLSQVLPVEIVKWNVENKEEKNILRWETADEGDGNNFVVEKSIDGHTFTPIATMQYHEVFKTYTYEDINPAVGYNYYRLKQSYYNGGHIYTNTIAVFNKKKTTSTLQVQVIHTNGDFIIQMHTTYKLQGAIEIIDMTGRKVFTQAVDLNEGSSELSCNLNELPHGVYLLNFNDNSKDNIVNRFVN